MMIVRCCWYIHRKFIWTPFEALLLMRPARFYHQPSWIECWLLSELGLEASCSWQSWWDLERQRIWVSSWFVWTSSAEFIWGWRCSWRVPQESWWIECCFWWRYPNQRKTAIRWAWEYRQNEPRYLRFLAIPLLFIIVTNKICVEKLSTSINLIFPSIFFPNKLEFLNFS